MMMGDRQKMGRRWSGDFSGPLSRSVLPFLLVFALHATCHAGSQTGADFLKIPVGARAVSLGQAYTALANDADSLNWNVAGMAQMPTQGIRPMGGLSFSHISVFEEDSLDNIAVALPLNSLGTASHLGFSVTRFALQEQQRRGIDGTAQGTFGGSDLGVGMAFATRVKGVNLGSQVKWIRQELAGRIAKGAAVDLGFVSPTGIRHFSIGGAIRNWGTKMKFVSDEYNLPMMLSFGTVFQPINSLSLVLDVHARPYQDQFFLAFGTEFTPLNSVAIRAGYMAKLADSIANNQKDETNRGTMPGLNGMSGGLRFSVNKMNVDYAFAPFGELGNTQTITISSYFGGGASGVASGGDLGESVGARASQNPQKSGEWAGCLILVIPFEKDLLANSIGK